MELKELGLTKYEVQVYETLIKIGKSSAMEISRESQVPYGRIYDTLNSLEAKGLIEVIPEQTKRFMASNPRNLTKIIDSKQESLKKTKKKILQLSQIYENWGEEPVTIVKGKKNFYKLDRRLPVPEKSKLNFRIGPEYRPIWAEENIALIKKGVSIYQLVNKNPQFKEDLKKWLDITPNMRFAENEGVVFSIIDDKAIMIALIKSNMTLLIKDKPFVKVMADLFMNKYDNAQKIKLK